MCSGCTSPTDLNGLRIEQAPQFRADLALLPFGQHDQTLLLPLLHVERCDGAAGDLAAFTSDPLAMKCHSRSIRSQRTDASIIRTCSSGTSVYSCCCSTQMRNGLPGVVEIGPLMVDPSLSLMLPERSCACDGLVSGRIVGAAGIVAGAVVAWVITHSSVSS